MRRVRDAVRRLATEDPETGWVVRSIGTVALVAVLLTTRPHATPAWAWPVYAATLACWLIFVVGDPRWPRLSLWALGAASLLPTVVFGAATDGTPVLLCAITLGVFVTHTRPPIVVIIGVALFDVVNGGVTSILFDRDAADVSTDVVALFILVLLGLGRRQYRVNAEGTRQLLEQTRRAQHEQARAAALGERTRIAREMHDVLAHSLGALGVQLELAEALLEDKNDPAAALARVRRARRLAAEGLTEARGAVAALRDDVPPLPDAITELITGFRRDHQVNAEFTVRGEPRAISSSATVPLLRTAREALTNAAKHAPGAPVAVLLTYHARLIRLAVSNAAPTRPVIPRDGVSGYGLTGMRERLALVGGTLAAGPDTTGNGWQVVAEIADTQPHDPTISDIPISDITTWDITESDISAGES
ncbi:MAG TPA: histidine kinase [Pseudonocardiaceae bacterium]|nr:histidine kinase [Pseudonocardiaceae bacterium]